MVQFAHCIVGIISVFTFHVNCIPILRSLYFKTLLASFLIALPFPQINKSVSVLWSRIVTSVSLIYWLHNKVLLPLFLVSTDLFHYHSSVLCLILSSFPAYVEVQLITFSAMFLYQFSSSIIYQQIHLGTYVILSPPSTELLFHNDSFLGLCFLVPSHVSYVN